MRSLTFKLTLAFLFVGITGALLVALFVGLRTERDFDQFVFDRYQADLITALTEYYQQNGSWQGIDAILVRTSFRRPGGQEFVQLPATLVDAKGTVVRGSRRYRAGQQLSPQQMMQGLAIEIDGQTVGVVLIDAPMNNGRRPPESPEASFLDRFRQAILFSALAAGAIALLLGFLLARTISRPVRELTEATQRVASGELGHQVVARTQDELGELATSFNQMSTDLAKATQQRRQMTADIAHELRTPLSVILGYTEALNDGKLSGAPDLYATMHGEAQLLNHLIDDLRILSLAEAGELTLNRQSCQPQALLKRTADALAALALQEHVDLRVAPPPSPLPAIAVDPERIAQVLGNLVSNALRYTPSGGEIVLSAEAAASDQVLLRVRDSGVGIAADDLPHIFDRFYRDDDARSQDTGESGLGLAIAKSLVEAHGGAIQVESEVGQGTIFTIALPNFPQARSAGQSA